MLRSRFRRIQLSLWMSHRLPRRPLLSVIWYLHLLFHSQLTLVDLLLAASVVFINQETMPVSSNCTLG